MAYRPGLSEASSPTYREGAGAGESDKNRVESCPPLPPVGMEPGKGAMWQRGYRGAFAGAIPHTCTEKCQQR